MTSTDPLAISLLVFAAIVLLAILAVIVWLQWQSSRSSREQATFVTTFAERFLQSLSESSSRQLEALRTQQETTLATVSSLLSSESRAHREHLSLQTQDVMTMLTTSTNRATDSLSSTARQLAELVASSQAMLATKDSIAFQQVRGATLPFTSDDGAEPYTSTEDLAWVDAERAEAARAAETSLANILKLTGVASHDPYTTAGSAFDEAAAAPQ